MPNKYLYQISKKYRYLYCFILKTPFVKKSDSRYLLYTLKVHYTKYKNLKFTLKQSTFKSYFNMFGK